MATHNRATKHADAALGTRLRQLGRELSSGGVVLVDVHGHPGPLTPAAHDELMWAAFLAIRNARREGRCNAVRLELAYTADEVTLQVVHDGLDLAGPEGKQQIPNLFEIRRALRSYPARLTLESRRPHGLSVMITVGFEGS